MASSTYVGIDRERCARRITHEIDRPSAAQFTDPVAPVTRYAFTDAYVRTLGYLSDRLSELGFEARLRHRL